MELEKVIENTKGDYQDVFKIIDGKYSGGSGVHDATKKASFSASEVAEIQTKLFSEVQARRADDGEETILLADARRQATKFVRDSFYNPATGIGTQNDPSMYATADVPVSISPYEATSYYSSGGLPQIIINKKSYGLMTNGYCFVGNAEAWTEDELRQLKEYADRLCFDRFLGDAIRDGQLYGGSILVPALKTDNPVDYLKPFAQLLKDGKLKKGSVDYLWVADRWNTVLIPDYNISAESYINPREVYVPIAGLGLNTSRLSLIRPKILPYWGTIRQMGWGVSDFEGWVRALLGYEIMAQTIPVMSQQMSLLYHHVPLDGMLAQSGPEAVADYVAKNTEAMRKWSSVNPRTMNLYGEVKTVNRTYTDFDKLMMLVRQDLSSKAGLAESVLFHTQSTGFSSNTADVTVKQAEILQLIGHSIIPQVKTVVDMLAVSCFGPEIVEKLPSLRISFETPTVVTDEERAEMGGKLFAMLSNGTTAGLPVAMSLRIAKQFVPEVVISKEDLDRLEASINPGEVTPEAQPSSDPNSPAMQFFKGVSEAPGPEGGEPSPVSEIVKGESPVKRFWNRIFRAGK